MIAIFGLQFVDRSFGPVLPLYVGDLGVAAGDVPFVSGVVFSVLACAAAAGHHVCAALLRRWSARIVISRTSLLAAGAVAAFIVVGGPWMLSAAAAVFGFSIGAAMTAAYTAAAGMIPASVRGAGFGLLSSSSLTALALSPAVSGFVGATDIRIVFISNAVVLCVLAVLVRHIMPEHSRQTTAPVTEDA
jgi:MFS family permease